MMKSYSTYLRISQLVLLSTIALIGSGLFLVPANAESMSPIRAQSMDKVSPSQQPSVLTYTVFLPLVLKPAPSMPSIKFTIVGYDPLFASEYFEHVHLCDKAGASTDISGWRIHSIYTNDDYYFPSGVKAQNCPSETTLNTTYPDNVNNISIFNWGKPFGTDEWPDNASVTYRVYLYDASSQLVATCSYVPAPPGDNGNANCN
jgi:hypothetical protein